MSLNPKIANLCLAACWAASLPAAGSNAKWSSGSPIVSYYAGPSDMMPLNDRSAAQLAAGGWNLGWANKAGDLDIYYRHGIRALFTIGVPDLDNPAQANALDAKPSNLALASSDDALLVRWPA